MIQKGTSQQIKNLMPKLLKLFFTKKKANGKSTLALMTLGVKSMEEIKIIVKGSDERAAMEALIALIESQFKV